MGSPSHGPSARRKRALRKGAQAAWRDLIVTIRELGNGALGRRVKLMLILLTILVTTLLISVWLLNLHHHHPTRTDPLSGYGYGYRYGAPVDDNGRAIIKGHNHNKRTTRHRIGQCQLTKEDIITGHHFTFIARVVLSSSSSSSSPSSWAIHTLFRGPLLSSRIPIDLTSTLTSRLRDTQTRFRRPVDDLVIASPSIHIKQTNGTTYQSRTPPARLVSTTIENKHVIACHWDDISTETRTALTQLEAITTSSSSGQTSPDTVPGVSLVAACKNRNDILRQVLPSWRALRGVNEIVLVDWGSSPHVDDVITTTSTSSSSSSSDPPLSVARVAGADSRQWTLSRAYNLAIRLAMHGTILKVDCDTLTHADFLSVHRFPSESSTIPDGHFFAANNSVSVTEVQTNPQALHANGVLLARRAHLLSVGGYDERLETYGWDDSDIVSRLSHLSILTTDYSLASTTTSSTRRTTHMKMIPINLAYVTHIAHTPSRRVSSQARRTLLPMSHPLTAPVEIQRNRLLLTRSGLSPWSPQSIAIPWQIHSIHPHLFTAYNPSLHVPVAALDLLSDDALGDVDAHALRLILRRFGAPLGFSALPLHRSLPVYFLRRLVDTLAYPARHAHVVVVLHGGVLARALAVLNALRCVGLATPSKEKEKGLHDKHNSYAIHPPNPFSNWHLTFRWTRDQRMGASCRMSTLFEHAPIELCDDDRSFNFKQNKCPLLSASSSSSSSADDSLSMSMPMSSSLSLRALHNISSTPHLHTALSHFAEHARPTSIATPWRSIISSDQHPHSQSESGPSTSDSNSDNVTIQVVSTPSVCDPLHLVTSSDIRTWLQPDLLLSSFSPLPLITNRHRSSHTHRHASSLMQLAQLISSTSHSPFLAAISSGMPPSARDRLSSLFHSASALAPFGAQWAGVAADARAPQSTALLARAGAVFVAACAPGDGDSMDTMIGCLVNEKRNGNGNRGEEKGEGEWVRSLVRDVKGSVRELFAGCEEVACECLTRVPELAVVSAALVERGVCVVKGGSGFGFGCGSASGT